MAVTSIRSTLPHGSCAPSDRPLSAVTIRFQVDMYMAGNQSDQGFFCGSADSQFICCLSRMCWLIAVTRKPRE